MYVQHKSEGRIIFSIVAIWVTSTMIGVPIMIVNDIIRKRDNINEDEKGCQFFSPIFVIISSIFSFFLPCFVMIYLYYEIFKVRMPLYIATLKFSVFLRRNELSKYSQSNQIIFVIS